jgi:hypothetical protein
MLKGEIFNTYTGSDKNVASGNYSHAEGNSNTASGNYSHVEGSSNTASGANSHAGGENTIATAESSTVIGRYNVADGTGASDPKHLFIVGNGTVSQRSNILEVSKTDMNVNGDIKRNNVPIYPLVYDSETESYIFSGLNS